MCVSDKYNFFFSNIVLSPEHLTPLIRHNTMVRVTLLLLDIIAASPIQSPTWAVKLVHLTTGRTLARENYVQFSIHRYADFLQQSVCLYCLFSCG